MALQLELTTILISAGAIHALFWALIFIKPGEKGMHKTADNILGLLLLVLFLCITLSILYYTRYILVLPHLSGIILPLKFLILPLLFLYIKALLYDKFSFQDHWRHFIPSVTCILYMIPYFFLPKYEKVDFLVQSYVSIAVPVYITNGLLVVQLLIYVFWIYGLNKVNRPDSPIFSLFINHRFSNQSGFLVVIIVFILLTYYSVFFQNRALDAHFVLGITSTVAVFLIGFLSAGKASVLKRGKTKPGCEKYRRSGFENKKAEKYKTELINFMEEEKPYLDPALQLGQLADKLSISSNHLSQLLNDYLGLSFFDFVNCYRIQHAQRMLTNPQYQHLTILGIANESGFSSKSSFYSAFKKYAGTTPGKYKDQYS